jgi:hypothetical protein
MRTESVICIGCNKEMFISIREKPFINHPHHNLITIKCVRCECVAEYDIVTPHLEGFE